MDAVLISVVQTSYFKFGDSAGHNGYWVKADGSTLVTETKQDGYPEGGSLRVWDPFLSSVQSVPCVNQL